MGKLLNCFLFCALVMLSGVETCAQDNKIDSLLLVLKTAKVDTNKVNTLNALSRQLYLIGSYDSALIYAENARQLAEKTNFKKGTAKSYNIIGIIYYSMGNYPDALENYFASLKIKENVSTGSTADKQGIAVSYNNIGLVYLLQGNYPDALKNHFASLKIREEIGDKHGIADSYGNIGGVYHEQGNYSDALKNYFACLKIMEEIGNKRGIADSYGNIGNVYYRQGNYSDALKNHLAALKIRKAVSTGSTGDKHGIAASYNNIGNVYYSQGNYPDALKNHFASLKIKEEIRDKHGIASSYNNIGSVYVKLNKLKEGIDYLNKSLHLAKEIGSKEDIKASYEGLAAADSTLGNYKSAYNNYKMYIVYRDSLLNEENTKKTVQTQMQYDFDKQQTADSITNAEQLTQEELKHNQEIQQQKTYTYGGVIGFLLMIVVAGVSFRAFKNKQKANIIIAEQKQLVEEKQKDILDSIRYAKRIQQSLLPTEKYIHKNLVRLRNKEQR